MRPRPIIVAVVAVAVAAWLFADTVKHYAPQSRDPNVIRFSHWGDYREYALWQRVIDAFQTAHPGVTVRHEYIVSQYQTVIRQQLVGNAAPDVMMFQDEPLPRFAESSFADLAALMKHDRSFTPADYDATALRSFTVDGQPFGLPVSGGTLMIYLNEDCFAAAEVFRGCDIPQPTDDWTLDDFRKTAKELTCDFDKDGRTDQFGFLLPWWVYYLPFVYANGADVLDETHTQWTFNDAGAVAAVELYHDLRNYDRVTPAPAALGQLNSDLSFLTGRVAMVINGPWFIPFLEETELRDHYRILPPPRGPGGRATRVTWNGLCLNAHTTGDRRTTAWEFMRFALSHEAQTMIAESRRALPARKDALDAFASPGDPTGAYGFVTSLAYAKLQPISPAWQPMDRAINNHLARWLETAGPERDGRRFLDTLANDPAIRDNFAVRRPTWQTP